MKLTIKILLSLIGFLIIGGCAIKLPSQAHYTLITPFAEQVGSSQSSKVLLVNEPLASPGYDSTRIIYTINPLQLQSYSQAEWVATPTEMLQQLMTEKLRSKHYFQVVLSPPFSGMSDFRLETRLVMLQQEYLPSHASQVHLIIWAALLDSSQKIIANQTFEVKVPASQGVYAGVLAANQAAEDISSKIAKFVIAQMKL